MGFIERRIRIMLCDRCGDTREAEGSSPSPAGWVTVVTAPGHVDPRGALETINNGTHALLCPDCTSWLRKFFEGRKVAD